MQIGCQNIHERIKFIIKTCILLEARDLKMFHRKTCERWQMSGENEGLD